MSIRWRIGIWFAVGLSAAVVAMSWLTWQIDRVDRARETDRRETELARRQAELQERVSSALYRLDFWTTPLLTQEAARPYYYYRPLWQSTVAPTISLEDSAEDGLAQLWPKLPWGLFDSYAQSDSGSNWRVSPLLLNTSEFVNLHFQIDTQNEWTSPQSPPPGLALACAHEAGVPEDQLNAAATRLRLVQQWGGFDEWLARCEPLEKIPSPDEAVTWSQSSGNYSPLTNSLLPLPLDDEDASNAEAEQTGNKLSQQLSRNETRGNREFNERFRAAQNNARSQWAEQQQAPAAPNLERRNEVVPGVMRPVWLEQELVLVRQLREGNRQWVQGCWLNWPRLERQLLAEVHDLLPGLRLRPVLPNCEFPAGRTMATLPVELQLDAAALESTLSLDSGQSPSMGWSGLRISLAIAWVALALAALAMAWLLAGAVRLNERQSAFVSAVTHELRTPLTTFRMYAEMLAEKMIPPEQETDYARTLQRESDRLATLVENVLQFARLEQQPRSQPTELWTWRELWAEFTPRLQARAHAAALKLEINGPVEDEAWPTHRLQLEQIFFNLVNNAAKYAGPSARDRRIRIAVSRVPQGWHCEVQDYGPGISSNQRRKLFQAFCKSDQEAADSAAGVGLGLALCQRMVHSLGGTIALAESTVGTHWIIRFPLTKPRSAPS